MLDPFPPVSDLLGWVGELSKKRVLSSVCLSHHQCMPGCDQVEIMQLLAESCHSESWITRELAHHQQPHQDGPIPPPEAP